jgi:hypothetical protein
MVDSWEKSAMRRGRTLTIPDFVRNAVKTTMRFAHAAATAGQLAR